MYLDEDPDTLLEHLVPPPELHLMMGIVDKIAGFLMKVWPEFESWLVSKSIIKRGYHGCGWDGQNANKILNNLDQLRNLVLLACPQFLIVVECLTKFREVKEACFGLHLDQNIEEIVSKFINSFKSLQEFG